MDYRARMYDLYITQAFIQPDDVIPDVYNPQSLNRYAYVLDRPTVLTDPTGHKYCTQGTTPGGDCLNDSDITKSFLSEHYGVKLSGHFSDKKADAIYLGVSDLADAMGIDRFRNLLGGVTFSIGACTSRHDLCTIGMNDIHLDSVADDNPSYIEYNTVHEFGHIWDYRCFGCMSSGMEDADGSSTDSAGRYNVNGKTATSYGKTNAAEDWAEALAAYINPSLVGKAEPGEQPYQMDPSREYYVVNSLVPGPRSLADAYP